MPRQQRLKSDDDAATYHCMSRIVNGEMLLDNESKEILRKQLHQIADFSGIEVITYALMTNHFHLLIRIPKPKQGDAEISDEELLRRYKVLYPTPTKWATAHTAILEEALKRGGEDAVQLRKQLLARMGDVSQFMKTLKQRFTLWFNKNHKRFGTIWAERFGSTIVEGNRHFALQMMAAYIDLNPVRAGLVKDPKDYRFCGYGEAESTKNKKLILGLRSTMDLDGQVLDSDKKVLASYRAGLFAKGSAQKRGDATAATISPKALEAVEASGGLLPTAERLRLRVRWFTQGKVIGGRQFVAKHLVEFQRVKQARAQARAGAASVASSKRASSYRPRAFSEVKNDLWSSLFAMRGRQ
jgi:REP element-mobilizing transposase RayT